MSKTTWNSHWTLPYGNESAMRRMCRKNTAGRWHRRRDGHAAADQIPMCWSLDFNCLPDIQTHIWPSAPDLLERSYCVSRGVSVLGYQTGFYRQVIGRYPPIYNPVRVTSYALGLLGFPWPSSISQRIPEYYFSFRRDIP